MTTNTTNSAKKLIFVLIGSIFISELLIMIAFALLPPIPESIEALLDASCLSILCAPFIYLFVFRPMSRQISLQKKLKHNYAWLLPLLKHMMPL